MMDGQRQALRFAASTVSDNWRTTWPVVSGMPNRAAGVRLAGNSIVPWIPYAIFAAINRIEGGA